MSRTVGLIALTSTLVCSLSCLSAPLWAQQDAAALPSPTAEALPAADSSREETQGSLLGQWDRLIYIPFRELQKVFDQRDASVVLPYGEYLELMKQYLEQRAISGISPDAVITASAYRAVVEKDIVRIQADLMISVLKEKGWSTIPLAFGGAAVGRVTPDDGSVILQGKAEGQYDLMIQGGGAKQVTLELLATVRTSPENRSFRISCPVTGMSELDFLVSEPDQAIQVSPLQVLLPLTEPAKPGTTGVRASLGAVDHVEVRWNPRAGARPVMDLLSSATNESAVRIESGLVLTRTLIDYEILRGELREVSVLAPRDARVIDVISAGGRIRSWNVLPVGDTHQQIVVELLSPVSERFQLEVQTERNPAGDTLQLTGRSPDGRLQGVHADGVVRESGRIVVSTDPALTAVVVSQSGVRRVDAGSEGKSDAPDSEARQAWEFSGTTGSLILQIRPVEPRLLVTHESQLIFRDDELRLKSTLNYTVERAGVFQLTLGVPESLIVDSVSADGMSEFNVDKDSGKVTLALTQKRTGAISVTILAHQDFDSAAEHPESQLPTLTPEGVERETGTISVFAPEFLDVLTVDEKLTGVFPARDAAVPAIPRLRLIASWNYSRRPISLVVRTAPRPAQLSATVGTTVRVEPEILKVSSIVACDIRNAGLDTLRIAVPESVAGDVRFHAVTPGHVIQQRNRAAQAEDGWVTWTLVLQDETTGTVRISVDWEVATDTEAGATANGAAGGAAEHVAAVDPPRVLTPFPADQGERRRVTLTQVRGEIRLLRHESLSITAAAQGDTAEAVDVRELELLPQDGYLAFRYFSQPAGATIRIRRHEIHEVVATVVARAAVEVVSERQDLAAYRCRYRITTSERQRLRIDLPQGCDLQAPLLNGQRTTIEKATDQSASEGWEAYFVNVSREQTSDTPLLLSIQFRCPIVESGRVPYEGRGGRQVLRIPLIGADDGSTVVQQIQLVLWAPKDVSLIGEPDRWTRIGRPRWSLFRPFETSSSPQAAAEVSGWIGDEGGSSGDFATQGHAAAFRALGRQAKLEVQWWDRPFLLWLISGTVVVIGFIVRRTPLENRITIILVGMFVAAVWFLKDGHATLEFLSAGLPGCFVTLAIWCAGLFSARRTDPARRTDAAGQTDAAVQTAAALDSGPGNPAIPGATPDSTSASSAGSQAGRNPFHGATEEDR